MVLQYRILGLGNVRNGLTVHGLDNLSSIEVNKPNVIWKL